MTAPPRHPKALFVTGTDTGVGKTRVAVRLIRTLRAAGVKAAGFKPILCGPGRGDAELLQAASATDGEGMAPTLDEVNPIWLQPPAAPLAAALAGESAAAILDLDAVSDGFETLSTRFGCVVIEGAGGWEVPLTEKKTFAALAREFAAPVIVVAANRIGVLNHARLTVDAVRRDGLRCVGVLLNDIAPPDPGDIARQTNLEVLRLTLPGVVIEPVEWNAEGPFPAEILRKFGLVRLSLFRGFKWQEPK